MAAVCLILGIAIGYLFRGSKSTVPVVTNTRKTSAPAGGMGGEMPSPEQMKHGADIQAAPLLEKLKSDPNNSSLLIQVGSIYERAQQFKEAAPYYNKVLQIDPKNVTARTELASSLYYNGSVDEAIQQLNQSLEYSPNDANSLFNLGAMKWRGKHDAAGALAAWQKLLKTNPKLSADKKTTVKQLIQEAEQHIAGDKTGETSLAAPVNGTKTQ